MFCLFFVGTRRGFGEGSFACYATVLAGELWKGQNFLALNTVTVLVDHWLQILLERVEEIKNTEGQCRWNQEEM